jgi:hypothetical protein
MIDETARRQLAQHREAVISALLSSETI